MIDSNSLLKNYRFRDKILYKINQLFMSFFFIVKIIQLNLFNNSTNKTMLLLERSSVL